MPRFRRTRLRRFLIGSWLVGALAWVVFVAAVHRNTLLQNPVHMAEDFRWEFADCHNLPEPPSASPADRMVVRVLCHRAQGSGLRRHLAELVLPPAASGIVVWLLLRFAVRRRRRALPT